MRCKHYFVVDRLEALVDADDSRFPRAIQLVSVVLGNHLTRKFGRTGVGNEQTAILGTTALRSIQRLSKSSLGQTRLRTQSRDQSCKRALVHGLKALSTGGEVLTLECSCSTSSSTSGTSVASLSN